MKLGQGNSANHFLELRQKQLEAQRDFHKKLLCELDKDPEETKNSAVAEALGTKFQVKTSKSSHQFGDPHHLQYEQEQGSLSVPSKSPERSRKGSFSDTYMSKGAFWSHSLPRRSRRVTFTDEQQDSEQSLPPPPPPSRPPPPAPVRQQSIHAMKDLSTFSTTYNTTLNTLQEKNQPIFPPETVETIGEESARTNMTNLQSVEYRSYNKARDLPGTTEADYKVDLGPARDPWVEVYGKSVLNNTLHDRLEKHSLQKSQSAVWNNSQVTEHQPVLSTAKLEKPKKVNIPQQGVTPDNCTKDTTSSTLPRTSTARTFPSATTSLRRNTSMCNLNGGPPSSKSTSETGSFQVPPTVVRGIVITVLQNQGITNPDEDILQRAIEEYYSKNPEGVSAEWNFILFFLCDGQR